MKKMFLSVIAVLMVFGSLMTLPNEKMLASGGTRRCWVYSTSYQGSRMNCSTSSGSSWYYGSVPYSGFIYSQYYYYDGNVPYVGF